MQSYKMEVSKTETIDGVNKRTPVGSVEVFYPLLSEMGIAIEPSGTDKDGFPTYADDKVQWVFDATLSAVLATARNRLMKGSIQLKDGLSIPDSVEALIATGDRSGEALKNRHATYAALASYLTAAGKPIAFVTGVVNTAKNIEGIPYQSESRRNKLEEIMTDFAASLSAEDTARFEKTILRVIEQCKVEADAGF